MGLRQARAICRAESRAARLRDPAQIAYRVERGFVTSGSSVGVRDADGALRPRGQRCHVHALPTADSGMWSTSTGAYSLGENIVQGTVDPDEFYVFKPTLKLGHGAVLRRKPGSKQMRWCIRRPKGPKPPATNPRHRTIRRAAASRTPLCWH
ncbi:PEP/pyruvate-binding domain-containing protein [Variovorax humicola]|uniref:PEP/pyruvate-binding domain-containing protein n=1 Tax=Variovorax humicola TaxID=1769758 RepID=A0ABU8W9U5_9BURK